MENNLDNKSFNVHRRDSGWLRLIISGLFGLITLLFLWVGYLLTRAGTAGDWKIVSNFKDWELYITSISPGLFVILLGAVIMFYGLPKVLQSL